MKKFSIFKPNKSTWWKMIMMVIQITQCVPPRAYVSFYGNFFEFGLSKV
jgi:hypothetical protein